MYGSLLSYSSKLRGSRIPVLHFHLHLLPVLLQTSILRTLRSSRRKWILVPMYILLLPVQSQITMARSSLQGRQTPTQRCCGFRFRQRPTSQQRLHCGCPLLCWLQYLNQLRSYRTCRLPVNVQCSDHEVRSHRCCLSVPDYSYLSSPSSVRLYSVRNRSVPDWYSLLFRWNERTDILHNRLLLLPSEQLLPSLRMSWWWIRFPSWKILQSELLLYPLSVWLPLLLESHRIPCSPSLLY